MNIAQVYRLQKYISNYFPNIYLKWSSNIFFILFIWQSYRNKDTDGNTYEEPFTTHQENAYETSANVYTNEEGGYEQLPVDHITNSGYSVQSDDPYDSIDDRIRSGLSRKEEIILEEKWYITEKENMYENITDRSNNDLVYQKTDIKLMKHLMYLSHANLFVNKHQQIGHSRMHWWNWTLDNDISAGL